MKYIFEHYSDVGGRENNEDSLCVKKKGSAYLFAVADGLGGHDCGEVASGIVADELVRQFVKDPEAFSPARALADANDLIMQRQQETSLKMKTTAVAVYICGGRAVAANIGDSRAYFFSNGELKFQTMDHSASQMAVRVGEITPDQIRTHEDRNILTRALGANSEPRIDVTELDEGSFDAALLCSDGFWEYVLEDEMCSTLSQSKNPSLWLKAMRAIHSGRIPRNNDNNTAIAIMNKG